MTEELPDWAGLKYPWIRRELLQVLNELTLDDPLTLWREQKGQGPCAGFDEVIRFLFDDHDFDENEIGFSLLNDGEVQAIGELKRALGIICDDLPAGNDEQSISHPIWPQVRKLAGVAANTLRPS